MSPLLIGAAAIVGTLAAYYILCGLKKPAKKENKSYAKAPVAVAKKPSGPIREYTYEEVAQHNKRTDLWLIVEGKVYDVTSFVGVHPGGDAILKYPGMDNTATIFHDEHPATVRDQLNDYLIGTIKK